MDYSSWEMKFYEILDTIPIDLASYHPFVIHFALALPLVAILFQWVSLLSPTKGYQNAASMLFLMGAFFVIAAFLSGKASAPDVKPLLSIEGQNHFDTHKELGTYIALFYALLMVIKLISLLVKKDWLRYLTTLMMVMAVLGLLYQVKLGHELVFQYGAGVESYIGNQLQN